MVDLVIGLLFGIGIGLNVARPLERWQDRWIRQRGDKRARGVARTIHDRLRARRMSVFLERLQRERERQ